jgi:hypothetical protein
MELRAFGRSLVPLLLVALTAAAAAQARRQQPPRPDTVPMEISIKVGPGSYDDQGPGSCTHAPKASIYGVVSQMWSARHQTDKRSLSLTLWRPLDGSGDMFTLAVNDRTNVSITTVRGGQPSGSGTVKLETLDKGGTFRVQAKGPGGEAVMGMIRCEMFMPHVAEGG